MSEFTTRPPGGHNFTSTTIHGSIIFDNSHEDDDYDDDDEEDEPGDIIEAIKVWVPIALTLILVLLVCFATIRAKTKRRRAREAGTSNPMTAVSGGVAMNVNVYRNYGVYVNQLQQNQRSGASPGGVTPQEALQSIPYYNESPPTYEDSMKMTGAVNASFSASQESVSLQRSSDPPPYLPIDPQREAANSESGPGQSSMGGASAECGAGQSSTGGASAECGAGQSSTGGTSAGCREGQSSTGGASLENGLESAETVNSVNSTAIDVNLGSVDEGSNSISTANTHEGPTESQVTVTIDEGTT